MTWTPASGPILTVAHLLQDGDLFEVWRVIRNGRGDLDNFRSAYELRRPPRRVQRDSTPIWMSLSMYGSREKANAVALLFPKIGDEVARIDLVGGQGFAFAETIEPGHLSVWGHPIKLQAAVTDIYPVQ